jgi:aminomethyltransferase
VNEAVASKRTPLHDLHRELGARMVPFAGYDMPVQYPTGIVAEHNWTRTGAGLFDVSHMGQLRLGSTGGLVGAAAALESLVPGDIVGLKPGRQRYTQFTSPTGTILDDLMVAHAGDHLFLVVNASRKAEDAGHLRTGLSPGCTIEELNDRALLALQGPAAVTALARLAPEVAALGFMSVAALSVAGIACFVSRSGYTGEDGFEISVPAGEALHLARRLLAEPEVRPIGLGARDSLRLEAGLCLYGQDIDTTTTPIEAGLAWSIGKRRRAEGGFPGAAIVQRQWAAGPARRRVGLRPEGRAPVRAHAAIVGADGKQIGEVTSGGFGPTVNGPVAMGYVPAALAAVGTRLGVVVRDQVLPVVVAALPFVPHRYRKV